MPLFVHRRRTEICAYQTPAEKLERYRNWVYPTQAVLNRPYGLIELGLSVGNDLVILPDNFSITGDYTPRQFNRFGSRLWLPKREADFIKEVKSVLSRVRTGYTPRGLAWEMDGVEAVCLYVCQVDSQVFYEAFEGDMAPELWQFQGFRRERVKVSPNYRQNNIVCEVPSRSLVDTSKHLMSISNPPTQDSLFDWRHMTIKHQCGDVIYNLELNVGENETGLEEHDLVGLGAAGKVSAQRGVPFKTNLVLPITREFAHFCGIVVNHFLKVDSSLSGGKVRNLREGERNHLFSDYIHFKQDELGSKAPDSLFYDSLEEFERELQKGNYILEILYPSDINTRPIKEEIAERWKGHLV
ncbi:MAG: hypothetical protein HY361_04965 [Candidatus Aenigmarchaeota archaeon]|nr:hypothetical protein [Candidatus Aenigmarchaeota archaeon]